jgi:hypothetical protein
VTSKPGLGTPGAAGGAVDRMLPPGIAEHAATPSPERTVSVPLRLRRVQFAVVCCGAESAHLQADSVSTSSLPPTRLDF